MRRHFNSHKDRRMSAFGRQLIDECESFLDGRYPSVLQAQGLAVPEWAWLSVLAHAPLESLAARAASVDGRRDADRMNLLWEGALSLLVQELFVLSERTGASVEELQHSLVVDIELDDRRPGGGAPAPGPSRLVEDVRGTLARHWDSHRR